MYCFCLNRRKNVFLFLVCGSSNSKSADCVWLVGFEYCFIDWNKKELFLLRSVYNRLSLIFLRVCCLSFVCVISILILNEWHITHTSTQLWDTIKQLNFSITIATFYFSYCFLFRRHAFFRATPSHSCARAFVCRCQLHCTRHTFFKRYSLRESWKEKCNVCKWLCCVKLRYIDAYSGYRVACVCVFSRVWLLQSQFVHTLHKQQPVIVNKQMQKHEQCVAMPFQRIKSSGNVDSSHQLLFTWTHRNRSYYNQMSFNIFVWLFRFLQTSAHGINMLCLRTNASFPLNTFRRNERIKKTRRSMNACHTTPHIIHMCTAPFSSIEAKFSCEMPVNDSFICV